VRTKLIFMKGNSLLLLLVVLCVTPVGRQQSTKSAIPDSGVEIPAFSVAVKLSKAAGTRLRNLKESVVVMAYFDGDGEPEPGIDTSPMRAVVLGSEQRQMNANFVAEFKGPKFTSSTWKRLSDKNYFVTINTFSARKVVADNILSCDTPIKHIETIKGNTLEVHCDLMTEHRF
jgi:hypothetical protein